MLRYTLLFLFCFILVFCHTLHGSLYAKKKLVHHFVPEHKRYIPIVRNIFNTHVVAESLDASSSTIYPTDYGADPTGKTDSTEAFEKVLQALLRRNTSGHMMANDINDLGGASVDLGGGDYVISKPIVIPINYGNFRFVSGTIRASSTFPETDFLISVGGPCTNSQGSCNENVGFEDMLLDSNHRALGGINIIRTMGANVGPKMFFIGYRQAGVTVTGGHETMIHNSWFGEYYYSDPRKNQCGSSMSRGIQLLGNDHFISNTIIFGAHIGVEVTGAANLLKGVHTWNCATAQGGIGILVNAPGYTQNRLLGVYLDYNSIVAVAPEHLTISDSFFLCGGNVVLKATEKHTSILGLNIIGNQFDVCHNTSVMLDEREAKFTTVQDTIIQGNMLSSSYSTGSTQASASLRLENSTKWHFDFSKILLFQSIKHVTYSIEIENGEFTMHASRKPVGNTVDVETSHPVTATVEIHVDQSEPSHACKNGVCT